MKQREKAVVVPFSTQQLTVSAQQACYMLGTWSCSYGLTFSGSHLSLIGLENAAFRRNGLSNVGFVCDTPWNNITNCSYTETRAQQLLRWATVSPQ